CFLGRLTLVVDVERSAAPRHGAIVDHSAFFTGDTLANQAGERRGLLAIEICLQSMAHGFVQQDAGPSRTKHDFHFSGGRFASVELQNRLSGGFPGKKFWILVTEEE